ncbi:MAG: molybdopterin-binding protein [Nitrosomonadales bacterium]
MNSICLVIIGDEILSGKRTDKHFNKNIELADKFNYAIKQVLYLSDDPLSIKNNLKKLKNEIVFCFGGIGATPDDHTRQAAAKAFNLKLIPHPEAIRLIEKRFGKEAYPKRILMANLPENAKLLPNTINQVPGFYINQFYFMPGFPEMAWPMIEWIYKKILPKQKKNYYEEHIILKNVTESSLIDIMQEIEKKFIDVKVYSLPRITPTKQLELGVKGNKKQTKNAMIFLKKSLKSQGHI